MASTYSNSLRLELIATGEAAATWGEKTNVNLTNIAAAFGYATQDGFSANADSTTTVADGVSDPARAMYFKVTSSATLTATRTLTIAPNTISRLMWIENATTGGQSIAISQGTGANVTIPTGKTAVVYLDGAGSGAAVVDAMAGVSSGASDTLAEILAAGNTTGGTDLAVSTGDDITFADNSKAIFGAGSDLQIYHDGSHSYIRDNGTGQLKIMSDGDGVIFEQSDGANTFKVNNVGETELFYSTNQKLATTATGIDVTGTVTADGLTVSPSGTQQVLATLRANSGAGGGLVVQTDASDDGLIRGYDSSGAVQLQFDTDGGDNYIAKGNVGIGTSSAAFGLSVEKDNGSGYVALFRKSSSDPALTIQTTVAGITQIQGLNAGLSAVNDIAMQTSGGNVGIGTASFNAANKLEVTGDINTTWASGVSRFIGMRFGDGSLYEMGLVAKETPELQVYAKHASGAPITFLTGATPSERMRIDASGSVSFYEDTGSSPKFFWDASAESLGIGTAAPVEKLYVNSTSGDARIGLNAPTGSDAEIKFSNNGVVDYSIGHDDATDNFVIGTVNVDTPLMSVTKAGNLLVGKTSTSGGIAGTVLAASGLTRLTADGIAVAEINRLTSNGSIVDFKKDGTLVGVIGCQALSGNSELFIGNGSNIGLGFEQTGTDRIFPCNGATGAEEDAQIDIGAASARFVDAFIINGVTTGSDERDKQNIETLSNAEQRVAVACKGLLRKWRWIDSVETKGDEARIHFGIIAQDLQAAFEAEGLDAGRYGMFMYDEWVDKETGEERNRMGIRYSELLAFIIAAI